MIEKREALFSVKNRKPRCSLFIILDFTGGVNDILQGGMNEKYKIQKPQCPSLKLQQGRMIEVEVIRQCVNIAAAHHPG